MAEAEATSAGDKKPVNNEVVLHMHDEIPPDFKFTDYTRLKG